MSNTSEVERLEAEIWEARRKVSSLQAELTAFKRKANAGVQEKYAGNCYIQDRYESGTRYIVVLEAEMNEEDQLDLYGYGAVWDEQSLELEVIEEEYPQWFTDCQYGELTQVTYTELLSAIKKDLAEEIDTIFGD